MPPAGDRPKFIHMQFGCIYAVVGSMGVALRKVGRVYTVPKAQVLPAVIHEYAAIPGWVVAADDSGVTRAQIGQVKRPRRSLLA